MSKRYNPKETEKAIQDNWKVNNYYKDSNKGGPTYTIVLPPPNVTGKLHLGHAWNSYYQDALIRYKQLNGYEAIWYPGMDHAGIATQAKVEQKLYKEQGLTRFDLGREKFVKQIWDWKDHYAKNIEEQWAKLGIALDYDKTKFTLDDDVNELITKTFIDFYNKGLIYRGERLINWDPKLKTAISNIEINEVEKDGKIYKISDRSGAEVEQKKSTQWFVKSSELAKIAKKAQSSKNKTEFQPKRFEKDFIKWLDSMEDWCISRQLWWGHRIPAWYKGDEVKVQIKSPGEDWKQDEDVLDTWFSSALWPLVFKNEDVIKRSDNKGYLTDTLFTGYDIILFWVSRMMFQTLEIDGRPPFKNAIIHGLIRDSQGRKMSKSLGNGIDPMEVIDKWGSDALRMFLLGSSTPGQDIRYNESKINHAWDVNNKLFNATKLIKSLVGDRKVEVKEIKDLDLTELDKFLIDSLKNIRELIDANIEKYNLSLVISKINKFIVEYFANRYLELVKAKKEEHQINNTVSIFKEIIVTLHPFIPFVTEEIYGMMKDFTSNLKESIMLERYSSYESYELTDKMQQLLAAFNAANRAKLASVVKNERLTLTSPFKGDEEFVNSYINNSHNANIEFNKTVEEAFSMSITPSFGIIYYSFDSQPMKPKKTLLEEAYQEANFELERAKGLLSNDKFVKNADTVLIDAEKSKENFFTMVIELIENERKD